MFENNHLSPGDHNISNLHVRDLQYAFDHKEFVGAN